MVEDLSEGPALPSKALNERDVELGKKLRERLPLPLVRNFALSHRIFASRLHSLIRGRALLYLLCKLNSEDRSERLQQEQSVPRPSQKFRDFESWDGKRRQC